VTFLLRLHLDPLLGCRGRPRHWTQTAPELSGSVVTQISQPTAHSPIWQLLPPFPEGCVYGLDLRPQPIPGGWVTPALLTRARTSCIWRVRGDLRGRLGDHIMMDIDNQSAEQEDYGPDAAAGGEPPSPLIRPRPAAVQGQEQRWSSAGDDEFRRPHEDPAFGTQSVAKKEQAKAAQADPVSPTCVPACPTGCGQV
jgi:hypothetical protein